MTKVVLLCISRNSNNKFYVYFEFLVNFNFAAEKIVGFIFRKKVIFERIVIINRDLNREMCVLCSS